MKDGLNKQEQKIVNSFRNKWADVNTWARQENYWKIYKLVIGKTKKCLSKEQKGKEKK